MTPDKKTLARIMLVRAALRASEAQRSRIEEGEEPAELMPIADEERAAARIIAAHLWDMLAMRDFDEAVEDVLKIKLPESIQEKLGGDWMPGLAFEFWVIEYLFEDWYFETPEKLEAAKAETEKAYRDGRPFSALRWAELQKARAEARAIRANSPDMMN